MPHATATFNGKVIAETDSYEFVEGNVYYRSPREVPTRDSGQICTERFLAYDDLWTEAKDAAWYYPHPATDRAKGLKDYVAFCG
ncbi:uncharacterized protein KY384_002668 [Bacidia gigantensis]|uniref:uncharacterized protein n=1 Tax=Bacidia gigantensis TaxID=2732470 RepID=UPI001D05A4F0|nr:uncharacterized protein KY384_002668 [Bacidia gigantensis]KAG8532790.1 hypothetical protein KY384_002668 [Bacidia gigantensis]